MPVTIYFTFNLLAFLDAVLLFYYFICCFTKLAIDNSKQIISPNTSSNNVDESEQQVKLFFYHFSWCPHCVYEVDKVNQFLKQHPEVKEVYQNNNNLLEGTSGHPVIVFFKGNCIKQIVGETDRNELENQYNEFVKNLHGCEKANVERKVSNIRNGAVCN